MNLYSYLAHVQVSCQGYSADRVLRTAARWLALCLQESLRASSFYCGDEKVVNATRLITRMGGGGSGGGGGPSYAPPDLPSQVLDARILYIGMPVRPPAALLLLLSVPTPSRPI